MVNRITADPSPRSEVEDAELIEQSCRDPDRFAAIFDRHFDAVYRYVTRRLGPSLAEDVAGETFLIAFRQRADYDHRRSHARPWLYGIATNLMHRHRRTEMRRYRAFQRVGLAATAEDSVVEGHAERVVSMAAAESARNQLGKALARLRSGDRDVLVLVAWEDLSYDEVADALGIPVGTVRSRLNRARRRVREALGGSDPRLGREESADE